MFLIKRVKKSIFKINTFILLLYIICVNSCGIKIHKTESLRLGEIRYDGTLHEGEAHILNTIQLALIATGPDKMSEIIADSTLLKYIIHSLFPTVLFRNLRDFRNFNPYLTSGLKAKSMIDDIMLYDIYITSANFLDKNRDKISNCRILETVFLEKGYSCASISLCQDANRNISLFIINNQQKDIIYTHLPLLKNRRYALSENKRNLLRRYSYSIPSEATIEIIENDLLYKVFLFKLDKNGDLFITSLNDKEHKTQQKLVFSDSSVIEMIRNI